MKPNIGEQLRLRLPLITSPVIMTWIIVGPGRIFPLVKIWVCLRAYRTSHRGWIKSCSLSVWTAFPGIPLVAARALVKWLRVGLDWFLDFFFHSTTPGGAAYSKVEPSSRTEEHQRLLRGLSCKVYHLDQSQYRRDKQGMNFDLPFFFSSSLSLATCREINSL